MTEYLQVLNQLFPVSKTITVDKIFKQREEYLISFIGQSGWDLRQENEELKRKLSETISFKGANLECSKIVKQAYISRATDARKLQESQKKIIKMLKAKINLYKILEKIRKEDNGPNQKINDFDHQAALSKREAEAINWAKIAGQNQAQIEKLADEIERLKVKLAEAREAINLLIGFIPEGWAMPLGWTQVVAQAKATLAGKEKP
jgi:hypothetical protein